MKIYTNINNYNCNEIGGSYCNLDSKVIDSTEDLTLVLEKTNKLIISLFEKGVDEKEDNILTEKAKLKLEKGLMEIFVNERSKEGSGLVKKEYLKNRSLRSKFILHTSKLFTLFLSNSMFKETTTNLALII